ncbi:MAG TPA: type IV toxin-antitoxin system AbiEi family antitoxin [Candidatus Methylomirabilis sp.]|nr:type IV toxin-antitoxin system AbiEi family antitoxin [Candidatus Methylomirabilis sp.]
MAPYISQQSAQICTENGIGYVDLAGNCRLSFGRVYVEREGRPNPIPQRRDLRSLYSTRTTRVLRVLLLDPKKTWKLQPLAREAGVSLGQVYNVKKLLADREWIRTEKQGLRLVDPGPLLTEWSQNYSYRRNAARDFFSLDAPPDIESKLATACRDGGIQYALTGFSAAARLAPMVRYQRVMAYVNGDPDGVVKTLGLKEVPSGANVALLSPYDDGVFYGAADVNGIQIVSSVQAYLDLIGFRGRGEEAATFLLEQVIQRQW